MNIYAIDCGFMGANPLEGTSSSTQAPEGDTGSGANGQQNGGWGDTLMLLIPILLLVIFFFISNRSQKKKEKEQAEQRNKLKIGDELITIGGIVGTVVVAKPEDDKVTIEVGAARNRIVVMKWAIQTIITKEDKEKQAAAKEEQKALASKVENPKQKD